MMDTLERLSAAHHALQTVADADANSVLLTGFLVTLASLNESLEIAVSLEPKLAPVLMKYKGTLYEWDLMRHDSAHAPERIFCEVPKGRNDPEIPNGIKVTAYDPKTDRVTTGAVAEFSLGAAIETAAALIEECKPIVGLK